MCRSSSWRSGVGVLGQIVSGFLREGFCSERRRWVFVAKERIEAY